MISNISIKNYALIRAIEIDLKKGLNVFTGETGAGKSIMLDAISLALGNRINHSSILDNDKKCVVELNFDIANYKLQDFFKEHDLDYDDESTLRREILPSGRSRAFINDTPVDLKMMKELGFYLIDIHSQHQNILLSDKSFQLNLVDFYSNNLSELDSYQRIYKEYKEVEGKIDGLKNNQNENKSEQDYWQYLVNELESANLIDGEEEGIAKELEELENASSIQEWATFTNYTLDESELSIIQQIDEIKNKMQNFSELNDGFKHIYKQLEDIFWGLKDIASESVKYTDNVLSGDNKSIDELNERQHFLQNLFKKHKVHDSLDLLKKKEELDGLLNSIDNAEGALKKLEKEKAILYRDLSKQAEILTQRRQSNFSHLSNEIKKLLFELEMPNANFDIQLKTIDFNENGQDQINFYFSSNPGVSLDLLSKSASGGELSRVMFCLKAILASKKALPVMILDEIDTGTSGEAAKKMADMMLTMGKNMQLIVITHLPQIAAKGENHYYIFKNLEDNKTETKVKELSKDERLKEVATLIEGKNPGESALAHAETLLQS